MTRPWLAGLVLALLACVACTPPPGRTDEEALARRVAEQVFERLRAQGLLDAAPCSETAEKPTDRRCSRAFDTPTPPP